MCPHLSSTQAQFYTLTVILVQLFIKHGHKACIYITHYCLDDKNDKNSYFIRWGCIKLIKSHREDISNVTKDLYFNKLCSFEDSIHRRILKSQIYHKTWSNTSVDSFSNNQKCLLNSKSVYDNDFWRITWHWLKTEHSALHHRTFKIETFD